MANPNWVKGVSGNPKGRKPCQSRIELEKAIEKATKENNLSPIEVFVQKSYKSEPCLIALMKKILPDLSESDFGAETLQTLIDVIRKGGQSANAG